MSLNQPAFRLFAAMVLLAAVGARLSGQEALPAQTREAIDGAVAQVLKRSGAPSASVAVVKDGRIVFTQAYGLSRIDPARAATPQMRYAIGSISKQFTAAAVLLLAEEGRLSLDDKVGKWLPTLTRANEVSIRQLLSMTAGYQDDWPQDYMLPQMSEPVKPAQILELWAQKPLDFEPGTKWQYSNTNYVVAGLIVEKVSGMGLMEFLHKRILDPLRMSSVYDVDRAALPGEDAQRYLRYALGPPRPAPKEAAGWIYAMGELAMTAHDLALWDISMIDQTILKPDSYRIMWSETHLADGSGTGYGLGVHVGNTDGHRSIFHDGEIVGFTAQNTVYPDARAAVVVLCNLDGTSAPGDIADEIAPLVLPARTSQPSQRPPAAAVEMARNIFASLQQGKIDRNLLSPNCKAHFTEQALKDFADSLGPLGTPESFTGSRQSLRGGMIYRSYRIRFKDKTLLASTFTLRDGKIEQYMVQEE
ncbi:MAG TPA: serine hydrolase domain-containing protein [Tepidisphaeraceae bacterium]|nr:serine hydrolase domain-containing protein [Tepidisphaeraceae bacterium]